MHARTRAHTHTHTHARARAGPPPPPPHTHTHRVSDEGMGRAVKNTQAHKLVNTQAHAETTQTCKRAET